jgi:multiple sugar transport system permease protein
MKERTFTSNLLIYSALTIGAILIFLPFFWMLSLSLMPSGQIFSSEPQLIPKEVYWQNYIEAFSRVPLLRFLLNGVIVCAGILVLQIIFTVPCSYALAQRRFRGRSLVFGMVLAGLLVPFHVTAIPIFMALAGLGLINTYTALIVPFTSSVFGLFLFRQFFARIPAELFDAARVDGLSQTAIVWRIAFPLAMPAATAFAIFSVTTHWNDLFWPLIATSDTALATPPRGILYFKDQESGDNVGPLMAGAVVITAPLVVGFLLAQRRFTAAIASAGMR